MLNRIIVNADDFGHSSVQNEAIATCFERKWISETTLIVNMSSCEEAVELARERGFADKVGLHLNFTEGYPLTDGIRRLRSFCAPDGSFVRNHPFVGFPYRREVRAAVKAEALAQLRRYKSFGFSLMHCDGHHHIQARWPMAELLFPLLKAEGFRTFRNCYPFPRYDTNRRILRLSRLTLGYELIRLIKGRPLGYVKGFLDYPHFQKFAERMPPSVIGELMVHPRPTGGGGGCSMEKSQWLKSPPTLRQNILSLLTTHV